jgi:hypothetical protein
MYDPVVVVMSVLERVLQGRHFGTPNKRQRVVFKSHTKQAQTANTYYVLYDNCQ